MVFKENIKNILKTSFFSGGLNFLSSILYLIYVDKYEYGIYLILLGVFAFAGRILQSFDDLIIKFQRKNENNNAKRFLITAFFLKINIFILISVLSLIILNLFPGLIIETKINFSKIFIFLILFLCVLNTIKTFLLSSVYSNLQHKTVFKINFYTSIIFFFLTLILITYLGASIFYFVGINIILSLLQIIFYAELVFKFANKFNNNQKIIKKNYFLFFYRNYLKKFSLPMSANHLLGYFNKDHGANVILGAAFGPEIISVIAISKNLYEFFHNFINNFIIKIYPLYFHYLKIKKIKIQLFKKIFLFGNLFYFFVFIFLIIFKDFYFSFMQLKNMEIYSMIYIIISFEFAFKFIPSYLSHGILVSKNTIGLLTANIFRTFISSILIFIGIYYNNILISLLGYTFGIIFSVPILISFLQPSLKFGEIKLFFIINLFASFGLIYYVFS